MLWSKCLALITLLPACIKGQSLEAQIGSNVTDPLDHWFRNEDGLWAFEARPPEETYEGPHRLYKRVNCNYPGGGLRLAIQCLSQVCERVAVMAIKQILLDNASTLFKTSAGNCIVAARYDYCVMAACVYNPTSCTSQTLAISGQNLANFAGSGLADCGGSTLAAIENAMGEWYAEFRTIS